MPPHQEGLPVARQRDGGPALDAKCAVSCCLLFVVCCLIFLVVCLLVCLLIFSLLVLVVVVVVGFVPSDSAALLLASQTNHCPNCPEVCRVAEPTFGLGQSLTI